MFFLKDGLHPVVVFGLWLLLLVSVLAGYLSNLLNISELQFSHLLMVLISMSITQRCCED